MAYVDDNKINEIRNSADIVDIIKGYVDLTNKGKNFFGVCPFHHDHSPSMSVSSEKQIYRCFSCGAAGNVFTFVRDFENVSFLEAVSIVAKKVGISFSYSSETNKRKDQRLYDLLDISNKFYQNNLFTSDGVDALNYLKKRCFDLNKIKEFEFGLSTSRNSLLNFLKKKGYSDDEISSVSLISLDRYPHDVFVNRIMIPIHDINGSVVGYTSRALDDTSSPKYLNSRENLIFKKGQILFNYHRAKNDIRINKKVIIVEGNMDALKMYASGFKNTIALMGTSLTSDQVTIISKLKADIILMFDNDNAGLNATYQNGNILKKYGYNCKVAILNDAKDPDEYLNKFGADALNDVINKAVNFDNFKLDYFKNGLNLNDVSDLSKYVKLVLDDLKTNSDEIFVELTLKKIAKDYNLDYSKLIQNNFSEKKHNKIIEEKNEKVESIKIDEAVANILLGMASDGKYINIFVKQLGFLPEKWQRNMINEIRYFFNINKSINLADFISYLSTKTDLYSIMMDIISKYGDFEINQEIFSEYIQAEKKKLLNDEIKVIKMKLKTENDESNKILLVEQLTKLKKEVEKNGSN